MVASFHDHSISNPLPKLGLRGPELFTIAAQDQRRLLFFLLCLFLAHKIGKGTPVIVA